MLSEEDQMEACSFFAGVLDMLSNPEDEPTVLAAVIELSRCAFLGFQYTPAATERINQILDKAIVLSATMSAGQLQ